MATENDYSECEVCAPVAIVGAGFSGLVLANILHQNGVHFQLFDSKSCPPVQVVGTIRLTMGRHVLLKLGHSAATIEGIEQTTLVNGNELLNHFSREDFLNTLRSRVNIDYCVTVNECIAEYSPRNGTTHYFLRQKAGDDLGPFNFVVAANGLFGAEKLMHNAVIGDARWQHDAAIWDFGRKRIHEGADIALQDACELGSLLVKNSSLIAKGELDTITPKLGKFASRKRLPSMRMKIFCSAFVVSLLAVWLML